MTISLEEQETTINLYPRVVDKSEIYSCEPNVKKKMLEYAEKYPDEFVITKQDELGIFASVPRDWFKIKPPRRLTMTPEQRAAAAERMKKAIMSKNA